MGRVLLCLINTLSLTLQAINGTTINSCPDHRISGDLMTPQRFQINDTIYTIYQSREALNWCQSHHVCKDQGQSLLTVKSHRIQNDVETILRNDSDLSAFVWLGSRRKDDGEDWTWINDSLTNYECGERICSFSDELRAVATLFGKPGNAEIKNDQEKSDYYICSDGSAYKATSSITWYEAQRRCLSNGTRLATLDEIDTETLEIHNYWVGLGYKPWLWIEGGTKEPVIYFKSDMDVSMVDERDCLTVRLSNMSWIPEKCSRTSASVVCQSTEGVSAGHEKTEITKWLAAANTYMYVGVGLGVAVICVIIVIVVLVRKGYIRRPRVQDPDDPGGQPTGSQNDRETAGLEVVCGSDSLDNYQLNTLIYDNAMEPSAGYPGYPVTITQKARPIDVGDVYSTVNKKGYSSSPTDQPLANNAYSLEGNANDSDTDESDGVVIVDNAVYGDPRV